MNSQSTDLNPNPNVLQSGAKLLRQAEETLNRAVAGDNEIRETGPVDDPDPVESAAAAVTAENEAKLGAALIRSGARMQGTLLDTLR